MRWGEVEERGKGERGEGVNSHLRVKDAGRRLDDADGLVVDADLVDLVGSVADNTDELQAHVLGLHVEDEGVGQRGLLAGGDGGLVADGGQVADDGGGRVLFVAEVLGVQQLAAQEGEQDGLGLVVGHVDDGLGRAPVDQLHAEDVVGVGEGGDDLGLQLDLRRAAGIVGEGLE